LLENDGHVRHTERENIGQMPARGFLGDKALRRVLRANITHLDFHERITFLEKTNVIARDLAAPSVNKIEFGLLARALFQLFCSLLGRQFCQRGIELLHGWRGGKAQSCASNESD